MDTRNTGKAAEQRVKDREQLKLLAIIALTLMLLITAVVNSVQKHNLRENYAEGREKLASCLSVQITHFLRTCDSLSTPGADIRGDLLPDLNTYFYAMQEIDDLLVYTYGAAYQVIPDNLAGQIKLALSAYDQAFSTGKPTDSAFSSLMGCATTLEQVMQSRYDASGQIIPSK